MVIVVVEILMEEIWLEKQITEKRQDEQDDDMANRQLVAIGARCGCWKLRFALCYQCLHPWIVERDSFLTGTNRE